MKRTMTLDDYNVALTRTVPGSKEYKQLQGLSPGGAANALGLARKSVHAYVSKGQLDAIVLTDSEDITVGILVTEASMDEYRDRVARRLAKSA